MRFYKRLYFLGALGALLMVGQTETKRWMFWAKDWKEGMEEVEGNPEMLLKEITKQLMCKKKHPIWHERLGFWLNKKSYEAYACKMRKITHALDGKPLGEPLIQAVCEGKNHYTCRYPLEKENKILTFKGQKCQDCFYLLKALADIETQEEENKRKVASTEDKDAVERVSRILFIDSFEAWNYFKEIETQEEENKRKVASTEDKDAVEGTSRILFIDSFEAWNYFKEDEKKQLRHDFFDILIHTAFQRHYDKIVLSSSFSTLDEGDKQFLLNNKFNITDEGIVLELKDRFVSCDS